MVDLAITRHPSPTNVLAMYKRVDFVPSDRPVLLLLHGALRDSPTLFPWVERLSDAADVILVDLPGHLRSEPVIPASVPAFAASVLHLIKANFGDRQVTVVGESLGGLVALAMAADKDPGPISAVLAFDPPMTTAKLWNVQGNFRRVMESHPENAALQSFGEEAFGIEKTGVSERIYYPLLDDLKRPATIVTGDIALLPPRNTQGVASLFDAVDQYVVRRFYADRVELRQVANCGHLLLVDARDACEAIIREALRVAAPAPVE